MQETGIHVTQCERMVGRRILALPFSVDALQPRSYDSWAEECVAAVAQGFNMLCVPVERFQDDAGAVEQCGLACRDAGVGLMLDVSVGEGSTGSGGLLAQAESPMLATAGVDAMLLRGLAHVSPSLRADFIRALAERRERPAITVWTPGMTPATLASLEGLPVDGVYSSLPWWNFRDTWLVEEFERLRAVAPVIAPLVDTRSIDPGEPMPRDAAQRLAVARLIADAVLVPAAYLAAMERDKPFFNGGPAGVEDGRPERPVILSGPLSALTVLFKGGESGRLLLLNPELASAAVARDLIESRLPDGYVLPHDQPEEFVLDGGKHERIAVGRADRVPEHGTSSSQLRRNLSSALRAPRIAIEAVRPSVDGGQFAIKRSLGERIVIRADIFMDGHEELAAELLWRTVNDADWNRVRMEALGNDVWEGHFTPRQLGRYVYAIRAWHDRWQSYCVQLGKKAEAGVDVSLEVEEGRRMLCAYLDLLEADQAAPEIEAALDVVGLPSDAALVPKRCRTRAAGATRPPAVPARAGNDIPPATPAQVAALLDPGLAEAVYSVDRHAFEIQTAVSYALCVERKKAAFSSWYELFPRSQSPVAGQHGTLRDVIDKLPTVRRMGFDVLYFPPIHPIGQRNRKGRNNSLQAGPDDPGSPYAIGSTDGGHDAVHPELGTLDDFRALLVAAQEHGLEIALDFAIQCSPDHPWLREHPDWFNWRVDGTLKYAENPPKRYEDIVNPDFYSPLASTPRQAALWRALRDIVLFWTAQGVRIFRVDNPHTKPLPFWEWLLREVRDRHPDVVFLSEAFTRPAMMYRLAKIGFAQSYTYFTWRNTKYELTTYMNELNAAPQREFFRPNFFVNTPDINPWFLQTSGRAGFLIRAVLACTLSGSWGMYNGFELCVADAVPGKEEYLDSEKYQLRQWDMNAPGNIVDEITRLNRIRRSHAALQSHLGIRFLEVNNEQILFYSRYSPERDSIVLVAVSLDPHHRQGGRLALPLEDWGLPEHAAVPLHDLFDDHRFRLHGRYHHVELTPERPFVLWGLVREQGGTTR